MQRIVLGIDFGMWNSRIAFIDEHHKPVVIHNQENKLFTPSVIHFHDKDSCVVGDEALNMLIADPKNTVDYIKRIMGRPGYKLSIHDREYTPQEIAALILTKLKTDAESYFRNQGQEVEVKDAVITVPAYYRMEEKGAIKQAGEIAGLYVLTIINELTAAALAFGINMLGKEQTVFVFDLGGGFDVAMLEINGGKIREIAVDGDYLLRGKDWDDELIKYVTDCFKEKYGNYPLDDPVSYHELYERVLRAKISLSTKSKVNILVRHNGISENVEITREKFEELSKDLLTRCRSISESVLEKSKKTWNDIDTVLLVGGSTYMPMIRNMIKEVSGKEPATDVNPDQCIAIGAAYQGHNITLPRGCKCCEEYFKEREKEHNKITKVLEDKDDGAINGASFHATSRHDDSVKKDKKILPYNIGLLVIDSNGQEDVSILFHKDTMLPAQCSITFGVADDRQFGLRIKLIEGIGHNVADYWEIGDINVEFKLPKKKGEICDVTYMISQYGIIKLKFKFENEELNKELAFSDTSFGALLSKTYYEILGVSEDADYAEIKKVYGDEYRKYINTRDRAKANARWVPVSEAWECLRDPNKREEYDSRLKKT